MKRLWKNAVTSSGIRRIFYSPLLLILSAITPVYQYLSRKRLAGRQRSRSKEWKAKVISLGNIAVGGSGKTPITMYLAQILLRRGKKVAIVHSGYGRGDKREYIIEPGRVSEYSAEQTGDEVSMMGRTLSGAGFGVGSDKKHMISMADEQFHPDIILIDDGYQRLDIEKDLDIILISTEILAQLGGIKPRMTCRLFPRGILREPVAALGRADLVFVVKEDGREPDYREFLELFNSNAKVVSWTMTITGFEIDGRYDDLTVLKSRRPFLFASIGSFDRMLRMLKQSGLVAAGSRDFGDHHTYTDQDFGRLKRLSDRYSADCYLTTAKDMVKLPPEGLDKPVYCLRLSVQPDDSERLNEIMDSLVP